MTSGTGGALWGSVVGLEWKEAWKRGRACMGRPEASCSLPFLLSFLLESAPPRWTLWILSNMPWGKGKKKWLFSYNLTLAGGEEIWLSSVYSLEQKSLLQNLRHTILPMLGISLLPVWLTPFLFSNKHLSSASWGSGCVRAQRHPCHSVPVLGWLTVCNFNCIRYIIFSWRLP